MSQLGNREPGLVGAVLTGPVRGRADRGRHPCRTRAIRDRDWPRGPRAVPCLGRDGGCRDATLTEFTLGGRRILRRDGRLTLEDGTLAGADLTLPQALRVMVEEVGVSPSRALAMATSVPAALIRAEGRAGAIRAGRWADLVHLGADWQPLQVWQRGAALL